MAEQKKLKNQTDIPLADIANVLMSCGYKVHFVEDESESIVFKYGIVHASNDPIKVTISFILDTPIDIIRQIPVALSFYSDHMQFDEFACFYDGYHLHQGDAALIEYGKSLFKLVPGVEFHTEELTEEIQKVISKKRLLQ